jgi:hypothetical protein
LNYCEVCHDSAAGPHHHSFDELEGEVPCCLLSPEAGTAGSLSRHVNLQATPPTPGTLKKLSISVFLSVLLGQILMLPPCPPPRKDGSSGGSFQLNPNRKRWSKPKTFRNIQLLKPLQAIDTKRCKFMTDEMNRSFGGFLNATR